MSENAKFKKSVKVVHLEPDSQRIIRARLARLPAAVHVLHEKSKQLLQNRLKSFFDKADDSLFELADKAHSNQEQNLFFDSMREVRVQRRGLEKRFATAIDCAFSELVSAGEPEQRHTGFDDTLTGDALSLVQNEDLEEMVAIESSISRANSEHGEAIQHISLRLDSLVPVKVYQKNNPIGPDVLCNAFMAEAKKLDIDIKAKLVLFKLFDKAVMNQLADVYKAANQLLVEHNVLPSLTAGGRVASSPQAHRPGPQASGSSFRGGTSTGISAGASGVGSEVLSALQGMLGEQMQQGASASELLQLLSQAQRVSPHSTDGAEQNIVALDVRNILGTLQQQRGAPVNIGRVDDEIINLVNMLFQFILDDRNLADPMKALISRLQIPMIKVALLDKTFFTKGGHAARRLLNEMATAALGWQGNLVPGRRDPLLSKIESIVIRLTEQFDTDVSIFAELLADFTSFIEKEKRRIAVLERRTLDAEDGKAKAEVARTLVSVEIELRTVNEALPEVVGRLISEAWQNVLFVIGLKHGYNSPEWLAALKTLEDLVWSVQVPDSDDTRRRLIQLVPDLLSRLRGGLDTISFNPFVMSELFKSLEEVHLSCIRGKPVVPPLSQPTQNHSANEPATGSDSISSRERIQTPHSAQPSEPVVASGNESEYGRGDESYSENKNRAHITVQANRGARAGASAVEDKGESFVNPVALGGDDELIGVDDNLLATEGGAPQQPVMDDAAADASAHENADALYMKQVAGFVQGAWFEMIDAAGASIRCRLAAVIKPTGKYIFVNRNGMKVAEKSQEELALAIKGEKIRALDNSMLFDRALETVVSSLRKPH